MARVVAMLTLSCSSLFVCAGTAEAAECTRQTLSRAVDQYLDSLKKGDPCQCRRLRNDMAWWS